jgi:hypothetical protein
VLDISASSSKRKNSGARTRQQLETQSQSKNLGHKVLATIFDQDANRLKEMNFVYRKPRTCRVEGDSTIRILLQDREYSLQRSDLLFYFLNLFVATWNYGIANRAGRK